MNIGFLFNHEQIHQVFHSAPTAFELSRQRPDIEVRLYISSDVQHDVLSELAQYYPGHRCQWVRLSLPASVGWLCSRISGCFPVEKIAMLKANVARFADLDALVVTEKTSLLLKTHFGLSGVRFIHTRHGAGDRAIGFDKDSGKFDLVCWLEEKYGIDCWRPDSCAMASTRSAVTQNLTQSECFSANL